MVTADIATTKADFTAGKYFAAGKDASDIVLQLLGPVVPITTEVADLELPIKAVPEFAAGLVYGFVDENSLKEIETCFEGGETDFAFVEKAIKDLETGDMSGAVEQIKDLAAALPALLTTCKTMKPELQAIAAWATIFKSKSELVSKVTKAFLLHHKKMEADISEIKSDFSAGQYFNSGKVAADLAITALGPVAPVLFL